MPPVRACFDSVLQAMNTQPSTLGQVDIARGSNESDEADGADDNHLTPALRLPKRRRGADFLARLSQGRTAGSGGVVRPWAILIAAPSGCWEWVRGGARRARV